VPVVVRAFVAVPCGERLGGALTTILDGWRAGPAGALPVRWTRPENRHLTLQFLGDWPESRLADLRRALRAMALPQPFTLVPGELGGFPNLSAPRVLFLHLGGGGRAEQLANTVRDCTAECWPDGPQDTRAFRAHLTLGRVKTRLTRGERNVLRDLKLGPLPEIPVEGFSLVVSELRPDGPRYSELDFFALRK
jgi:2'-5' RNA ligase